MPIPAYATFKDDSGGDLKGSVTIAGREGTSEVMEFDHDVYIPTDANNGRLTGVRVHRPVKLVKAYIPLPRLLQGADAQGSRDQVVPDRRDRSREGVLHAQAREREGVRGPGDHA